MDINPNIKIIVNFRHFGSIDIIYMQQVQEGEELLFARIVFVQQETIAIILNGNSKAKFVIDGKHVWARRYIPKKKEKVHEAS